MGRDTTSRTQGEDDDKSEAESEALAAQWRDIERPWIEAPGEDNWYYGPGANAYGIPQLPGGGEGNNEAGVKKGLGYGGGELIGDRLGNSCRGSCQRATGCPGEIE